MSFSYVSFDIFGGPCLAWSLKIVLWIYMPLKELMRIYSRVTGLFRRAELFVLDIDETFGNFCHLQAATWLPIFIKSLASYLNIPYMCGEDQIESLIFCRVFTSDCMSS